MATFTCRQMVLMVGMLATGSINTLNRKAQNDFIVQGYKSPPHSFEHPWFQTWMLCIAMSLSLVGLPFQRRRELQEYRKQVSQTETGVMQSEIETGPPVQARIFQWSLMIPACTTVISNSLSGTGLLYVDASVFVMLRGSVIIFTGILSKIFLKRKFKPTHWLGMITVVVGLLLAGCSSVFKSQKHMTNGGKTLLGISLTLLGQLVASGRLILEERLLKKRNLHPLHVVGMRGMLALVLMSFIVLPVLYFIPGDGVHNSFENSVDALYQIYNDSKLLVLCILHIGSAALYNYFAVSVIKSLTAVHKTLLDACRIILVWGIGLIVYYAFDKNFGEPFDKSYGILQVDGFLLLVIGTAMYNQLIDNNQLIDIKKFVPFCTFTIQNCVPFCTFTSQKVQTEHDNNSEGNKQGISGRDDNGIKLTGKI